MMVYWKTDPSLSWIKLLVVSSWGSSSGAIWAQLPEPLSSLLALRERRSTSTPAEGAVATEEALSLSLLRGKRGHTAKLQCQNEPVIITLLILPQSILYCPEPGSRKGKKSREHNVNLCFSIFCFV